MNWDYRLQPDEQELPCRDCDSKFIEENGIDPEETAPCRECSESERGDIEYDRMRDRELEDY